MGRAGPGRAGPGRAGPGRAGLKSERVGPGRVEKLGPVLCFKLQNSMAHIRRSDRVTSIFIRLHWLKIADRIDYKSHTIYLFSHNRFNTSVRQLRSSDRLNRLYIDVSKIVYVSPAFCHATPTVWNRLPCDLIISHRKLKSHLYRNAFSR